MQGFSLSRDSFFMYDVGNILTQDRRQQRKKQTKKNGLSEVLENTISSVPVFLYPRQPHATQSPSLLFKKIDMRYSVIVLL